MGRPNALASKKDGKVRFCVDYRKHEAMTVRDMCLFPTMAECNEPLRDETVLSTTKCSSGCWQTEKPKVDRV